MKTLQLHLENKQLVIFRKSNNLDHIINNDSFAKSMLIVFFVMKLRNCYIKNFQNILSEINKIKYGLYEKIKSNVIGRIVIVWTPHFGSMCFPLEWQARFLFEK